MFKKGDIVKYNAVVRGIRNYATGTRQLERYKTERHGIILGYSFLKTGKIVDTGYYDEPRYLKIDKSHKVYVIEPLEQNNTWLVEDNPIFKTNRYLEPVRCFEADIELIQETN